MYPTKKEILKKEIKFKIGVIFLTKNLKKEWIKLKKQKQTEKEKIEGKKGLLAAYVTTLGMLYDKQVGITFDEKTKSHYNPKTKMINIQNLSIITTMHEFAHHILGSSEKKACIWSVWLFKRTFPRSYKKLKWNKHMLIKK